MDTELLHRMKSIRQTVQISNAQKLIAVAHIGKARELLLQSRPYHERVCRAIADVLRHCPAPDSPYIENEHPGPGKRGLLVLSANRGLTGGFNSNLLHFTEQELLRNPASYLIVLGSAGRSYLIRKGYPVDKDYDLPLDPPSMHTARDLADMMVTMLEQHKIDSFDIIYTEYMSSIKLDPVIRRLFPVVRSVFTEFEKDYGNYSFEPSPELLIASMMQKYIKGYLYGCLVNTYICELTARLTAMDSAIRNGNKMLGTLSLMYNRARQASITQEITEIVAGAIALKNPDEE